MLRHPVLSVFALAAALFTSGCLGLGGEPPVIARHAIDLIHPEPVAVAEQLPSLAVRSFEARQRYEARVLRVELDGTKTYLEFDRWLEDPQDALTDVVREALADSRLFTVVGPATSGFEGDLILDGTVLECDLLRTAEGPWRARLKLRLDVARTESSEMLHAGVYTAEHDLPGASAAGLGRTMSRCAGDVIAEALATWQRGR